LQNKQQEDQEVPRILKIYNIYYMHNFLPMFYVVPSWCAYLTENNP